MTFVPVHGFSLLSEQSSLSNLKPKYISIRTHRTAANWEWTLFCIMHTNFCRNESIFDYFVSVSLFWVSNELKVERSSDYVIKVTILMSFLSSLSLSLLLDKKSKAQKRYLEPNENFFKVKKLLRYSRCPSEKIVCVTSNASERLMHSVFRFSTLQIPLSLNIPDDEIVSRGAHTSKCSNSARTWRVASFLESNVQQINRL